MRRSGLFWGLILLLVGLLLLLNNLGVVSVDLGSAIWAIVLIAFGLGILWSVIAGSDTAAGERIDILLGDAISARLHLEQVVGRLRVDGSAGAGHFLEGTFASGVNYRARHKGDQLDVEMSPRGLPFVLAPWNWGREGHGWIFGLNKEIPLYLELETGASDARLDLSELNVTDLRLETGASSVDVTLPARAGHTRARIECGAASVSLRVPADVAARVRFKGALASVNVDRNRFPRTDGAYQSPDYDTAEHTVDIQIEAGVGSLRVF